MNTKLLTTLAAIALATGLSPATANAQAGGAVERNLAGVWTVSFSPRNCITGIPVPGAEFEGLYTFHKDGTMSAWVQNAAITLTRSPSHGLWKRDRGWSEYSFAFVHLRYDGSGFFSGKQVARGTLVLGESGNEFTTDGSNTFYDADGNPMGTGCASSVGIRFELEL